MHELLFVIFYKGCSRIEPQLKFEIVNERKAL